MRKFLSLVVLSIVKFSKNLLTIHENLISIETIGAKVKRNRVPLLHTCLHFSHLRQFCETPYIEDKYTTP